MVHEFYTHQDYWFHTFSNKCPKSVCCDELLKNSIEFGGNGMIDWVERHGLMRGHFGFFETFAENSEFYQRVVKPLLSMCTIDSIDVQHRIKPIKHNNNILTKKQNYLHDPKGMALYIAQENLKYIMNTKKIIDKKITGFLLA